MKLIKTEWKTSKSSPTGEKTLRVQTFEVKNPNVHTDTDGN